MPARSPQALSLAQFAPSLVTKPEGSLRLLWLKPVIYFWLFCVARKSREEIAGDRRAEWDQLMSYGQRGLLNARNYLWL